MSGDNYGYLFEMKAVSGLFFLLLVLSGCTTIEDPRSKEPPAKVTVYREPSSRDSFFPMQFSVDGRPVTVLSPDDERTLEIKAGERRFAYELDVYHCAADVRLESGRTYVYRLARGCIIEPDDGRIDRSGTSEDSMQSKWQEQDRTRIEETEAQAVSANRL
jgi:hypothetical protein